MSSSNSPCAACKSLRRKCTQECVFAPYFPPDQPQKFSFVHKIFGASNVAKLLNELTPEQREDAVNSLFYEAEARLRDPVYGCVGLISVLQHRLKQIQHDLDSAKKELAIYIGPQAMIPNVQQAAPSFMQHHLGLASPSSSSLIQNQNMMPMLGLNIPTGQLHGSGRMLLRDNFHHSIFEPQQFATAVSVRKHLQQQNHEMFRTYGGGHHQQETLSFNNGFVSSDPGSVTSVTSTGFNNQMSGAATGTAVVSPSLALGSSYGAFQIHNNPQSHVLSQTQPSVQEPQTQPRLQQQPYEIAQLNQQRKNKSEVEEGRSTEGPSSCF